jgi:autotransporter translocation and assembly factor TamB
MRYVRKILRAILYTVSALLLLILLLVFLLKQGVFNDPLANLAASQATRSLNGNVSIERIEGDVLESFRIHGMQVTRDDSSVVSLDTLKIQYVLSEVLKRAIFIRDLQIHHLHVNGKQEKDSTWSFQSLLPQAPEKDTTKETGGKSWTIRLRRLLMNDIQANLRPLDTTSIPRNLRLDGSLEFLMQGSKMKLSLDWLSLETVSPDLVIRDLSGQIQKEGDSVTWSDLAISFAQSQLNTQGSTNLADWTQTTAEMQMDPLSLPEFQAWMPGMKIYGTPRIRLNLEGDSIDQKLNLNLQEQEQSLSVEGNLRDFNSNPVYQVNLKASGLNGEHWTRQQRFHSLLSGSIQLSGSGFDIRDNSLNVQGSFHDARYGQYKMEDMRLQIQKMKDTVQGSIKGEAWFGDFSSSFDLKDIFRKLFYSVEGEFQHLDLARLTGNDTLRSDLNLAYQTSGKGTHPDSLDAEVTLTLKNSSFLDQPVSAMETHVKYQAKEYSISGFNLKMPALSFSLQGEGDLDGANRLRFAVYPGDLSTLTEPLGLPSVSMDGNIRGNIEGTLDLLDVLANYQLSNLRYDSVIVRKLNGEASSLLSGDTLTRGSVRFTADSIFAGNRWIASTFLESSLEQQNLLNRLHVQLNDSVRLSNRSMVSLKQDPLITIQDIQLHAGPRHWTGGSDSTTIRLAKDSIVINHFALQSGEQQIGVQGRYAFQGEEDLRLHIRDLSLGPLSGLVPLSYKLEGRLNSEIALSGSAADPVIRGKADIEHFRLDTMPLRRIHMSLRYDSDTLYHSGYIDAGVSRMIQTRARVPLHFSLNDSLVLPGSQTPLQASLDVDSLDVAMVNPLLSQQGMTASGLLEINLDVSHTLGDPFFDGRMQLSEGRLQYPEQGIDYRDIDINSTFNRQRFQLQQARFTSGKGFLKLQGFVDMTILNPSDSGMMRLEIEGKDFEALHSRQAEAVVDPSILIEGSSREPRLQGRLRIPQAVIYIDAFRQQQEIRSKDLNPPLLIEAMEDTLKTSIPDDDTTRAPAPLTGLDFYRNLQGTFDIDIPGNTWVRGEDMNFEVQGELKAIKRGEQMDLFGDLNVRRGYFEVYGKKFDFEQGQITFTGGRQIDPRVDFVIAYIFRDADRERQRLTIHVTGRSRQPELAFRLNEQPVPEKEAFSYLMFGKAPAQLTTTEQTSLEERTGSMAASFALNTLSSAVTRALGNGLGLDMVELSAGKNWKSGNVKIGKYITNDLYLGYQKSFAFDKKEKSIATDKITLEYQILRSLFLQATNQMNNSGFDLIFKKTWK